MAGTFHLWKHCLQQMLILEGLDQTFSLHAWGRMCGGLLVATIFLMQGAIEEGCIKPALDRCAAYSGCQCLQHSSEGQSVSKQGCCQGTGGASSA